MSTAGRMMELLTEVQKITQSSNPFKTAVTAGLSGSIKPGMLRSVYWRIFLGLLQAPRSKPSSGTALLEQWEEQAHELRKSYAIANRGLSSLTTAAEAPPKKKKCRFGDSDDDDDDEDAVRKNNPLSTDQSSVYAKAFQRKKLEEIVDKDMGRLWSDDPFFEDDTVRTNMKAILLDFCDEDRAEECGHTGGYRQGMHEVLSLIFYTVHRDAELVASLKPKLNELSDGQEDDLSMLYAICSPSAVVQDSYMIFSKVMTTKRGLGLVTWYHGNVGSPTGAADFGHPGSKMQSGGNVVVDVASEVQGVMLRQHDDSLWRKLNKDLDIQPASYLLRWLRLLFLREFSFAQVSLVWDAILAEFCWRVCEEDEQESYSLQDSIVPHIALSMLLYVSSDLLNSDFSFAVRRLMRYPPVEDTKPIISKSIERRHRGSRIALIAGIMSGVARHGVEGATPPTAFADESTARPVGSAPLLPPPVAVIAAPKTSPASSAPPPLAASFAPALQGPPPGARKGFEMETTATLRDRQIRQGMVLTSVIRRFEAKWFPPKPVTELTDAERAAVEDDYLVAIAELKRVRDVLLNSVPE